MPMTMAKRATFSAKYAVLSAVVSAVSVTQIWRAGFATGLLRLGIDGGGFSSLVGLPALSRNCPIWAYVWPPVASSVCLRMTVGEGLGLAAGVDLLAGDRRVRRTDDLLAGEVAADLVAAVDADDDGADAERDQDDAGGDAAVAEQLAHGVSSQGV